MQHPCGEAGLHAVANEGGKRGGGALQAMFLHLVVWPGFTL
jgi:hypothetical protein